MRHRKWRLIVAICAWDDIVDACETNTFSLCLSMTERGMFEGRVKNTGCYQPETRCELARLAMDFEDWTHILFIDADMMGFDIGKVERLLEAEKPIISGWYCRRQYPHLPVHAHLGPRRPTRLEELESWRADEVREVHGAGGGFLLVEKGALETMMPAPFQFLPYRADLLDLLRDTAASRWGDDLASRAADILANYEDPQSGWFTGEDFAFSINARRHGIKTYVHYGVQVGHIREDVATIEAYLEAQDPSDDSLHALLAEDPAAQPMEA
jgi:hypothetical protein